MSESLKSLIEFPPFKGVGVARLSLKETFQPDGKDIAGVFVFNQV
jgi:hypothetical protein